MCHSPLILVAAARLFPFRPACSLVLSLPSIAVTCVLKAVISTLCSIATMSPPLLYFLQFSQARGCLSVEADSPSYLVSLSATLLLCHCILAPVRHFIIYQCLSKTTFLTASPRAHRFAPLLLRLMNKRHPILRHLQGT